MPKVLYDMLAQAVVEGRLSKAEANKIVERNKEDK